MKILQINTFGFEAGGAEKSTLNLKEELIKNGHSVKLLTSDHTYGHKIFSDFQFSYPTNLFLSMFARLFNVSAFLVTKKILTTYKPDVIHLHRMDYVSPSVLFLLKNYPTVMTIHGPEDFIKSLFIWFMPHSFFKNHTISKQNLNFVGKLHYFYHMYLQRPIYKLGLKNVNLFITPSTYFAHRIDEDIKPILPIHNGVNLFQFFPKQQCDYKLLYVGRLDKTKGVDYLIQAMPEIIKRFPTATLSIVGEGIHRQKLIELTQELNLRKNISFISWQKSEKIKNFYKETDIVIIPSIWPEAFGTVGIEAMSVGRPVIASRVGGMPEWLDDGKTGYLVDPKNAKQISEKVIALFSNKKTLKQMGEKARKKAEQFSIDKYVKNIEDIYQKVITKKIN